MTLTIQTSQGEYDIILEHGALQCVGERLSLDRRVLVVTDDGVPPQYAATVAAACKEATVVTLPQGESTKQLDNWQSLLQLLVTNGFTRTDCVIAVGGGVVGDLAGFAAAAYLRGIDFYNIPTTLLSQVDSSIGGKTAVDFMGLKNLVGAFYPPKRVIIDPDTLTTLPARQLSNGLAEAVKMALTSDVELFELFEHADITDPAVLDTIIERSLLVKQQVVEADERESGLRRVLNFGHTIAHGIESCFDLDTYYHGECVALGMIPMCGDAVRERLIAVLEKLQLPTTVKLPTEQLVDACRHDKKTAGDSITLVTVPQVGSFELTTIPFTDFESQLRQVNNR